MDANDIIKELKSLENPDNVKGMARFGMFGKNILGISIPALRKMAKEIKKQENDPHQMAEKLWQSEIHEARILASMIDEPKKVTEKQMESWVKDFESWDLCDQTILNLFHEAPWAYKKATQWATSDQEFIKRAGFAMMAVLAWHDKTATDSVFAPFLKIIKKEATDSRNFVKKAVNWALRQIGKRNPALEKQAIQIAKEIAKTNDKTAQWVAGDALRELTRK